eukprot:13323943-Alexandrium_andersonii.AAC.1
MKLLEPETAQSKLLALKFRSPMWAHALGTHLELGTLLSTSSDPWRAGNGLRRGSRSARGAHSEPLLAL